MNLKLVFSGDTTIWPIKLWTKMRVGFSKQVNASVTLILLLTLKLVIVIATIITKSEKKILY